MQVIDHNEQRRLSSQAYERAFDGVENVKAIVVGAKRSQPVEIADLDGRGRNHRYEELEVGSGYSFCYVTGGVTEKVLKSFAERLVRVCRVLATATPKYDAAVASEFRCGFRGKARL